MIISTILASTVAIIGGGPSGLAAAKEAKACGLAPTVFEKSSGIGGVWNPESGKTWINLKINNSRYSSTFSDFPWDQSAGDFPNPQNVYRYLCEYADHFQLFDAIQLNCEVTKVERFNDKWAVEWICDKNGVKRSLFDAVVVCSGIFAKGYIPEIEGLETFKGTAIHSESYKAPDRFKGKTVAVVGSSFSGTEIAAEIAQKADKVFHIFARPYWLLSRYRKAQESEQMLPFDLTAFQRSALFPKESNEKRNMRIHEILEVVCKGQALASPDLAVLDEPLDNPFFVMSDTYLGLVKEGRIIPKKGSIERIQENSLYLEDKSQFLVDEIVFATGYRAQASFFDENMKNKLEFDENDPLQPFLLYKATFHPKFPNMAFIGMARFPIFFGVIELQARLACMALSHKIKWPSDREMEEGLSESRAFRNDKRRSQNRYNSHMALCEELANEIGVLPDFSKLQKTDPILYEKLVSGPFTTASYRLVGFGNSPETALKMIDDLAKLARE